MKEIAVDMCRIHTNNDTGEICVDDFIDIEDTSIPRSTILKITKEFQDRLAEVTSEVTSDGDGVWRNVSRNSQIWEMISKSMEKRIKCRLDWVDWYNIKITSISKSNIQKVHDIKKFLIQSEYAYRKRNDRLLEELSHNPHT